MLIDPNKALAELCRRSFFRFIQEFWYIIIPEDPVWNWHIKYLAEEAQEMVKLIEHRRPKKYDLIVNIIPGSSKSTIFTVMLPVWTWVRDQRMRTLTASYSATLSTDHSVKSRDIIKSDKFKALFPQITIKYDQDNKTHYKNNKGGERIATSVGGTITGFHAHLIVVDDPLNPQGAASEIERKTANDFMDITLSTRKVDKRVTPTILVMQRLHEDDCTGNWLKKRDNIKHICLPGEESKDIKPKELIKKYKDGLLDPARADRKALDELKANLGSYGYAGQIMQTPTPKEGAIWQKWIIPIERKDLPKLVKLGTDWDTAYTKNDKNAANAFITAGIFESNMYITGLGYKYLEFPDLITFMKQKQFPPYIEAKASGLSAIQTLKKQGIPAVEVKVAGGQDKIARTRLTTPFAESGMIYCVTDLLHLLYHDQKQGILLFPNTGMDLNDAFVQSINRLLTKKIASVRRSGVL